MNYIKKLWNAHVAAISAMMMAEYSAAMVGAPASRVPALASAFDKWSVRYREAAANAAPEKLAYGLGYDDGYEAGANAEREQVVAYIREQAAKMGSVRSYRGTDIAAGMLSAANDIEEGCHEPRKVVE